MISGAVAASLCVAVGAFVQGWDTSAIAGGLLYLVPDLKIQDSPQLQGAVVSTNLICAVLSAGLSGPASDWLGRRILLMSSALLFLLAGGIMAFAQTIYQVLLGRAFVGISNGILVSMSPLYISEVAPPEIRGQLSTLPQLTGSLGLVAAYAMDFVVSLEAHPNWRFMLGAMVVPSAAFLLCMLLLVPESPRWLVSKGRMAEAREVLQRLLNREDVTGELALQVEGLHVGGPDVTVEEWTLKPAEAEEEESLVHEPETHVMKVFGGEEGCEWIAKPVPHDETTEEEQEPWQGGLLAHSLKTHTLPVDPIVLLLEGAQDILHSQRETPRYQEGREVEDVDYGDFEETVPELEGAGDDSLETPLLRRELALKKPEIHVGSPSLNSRDSPSFLQFMRRRSMDTNQSHDMNQSHEVQSSHPESGVGSLQVGGGFLLTYEWEESKGENGENEQAGFKRVFLLEEPPPLVTLAADVHIPASEIPGEREVIHTAAIVASSHVETIPENAEGPAMIHPAVTATKGPLWSGLSEPGVRRALVAGVGLQVLQQGTGIQAIMGFAPMIFKESGADFLQKLGIGSNSASIFFSGFTCLLMLPAIAVAMRLIDSAGRRQLLLMTAPFVAVSLAMLSIVSSLLQPGPARMILSFLAVGGFTTSFVMGFGPIPSIFCSEIFPTRARGLCMGICIVAQWLGGILVSQTFPLLLVHLGMPLIFCMYVLLTCVAWAFVYVRVPETKGLPLEVIIEFFSLSAASKGHAD